MSIVVILVTNAIGGEGGGGGGGGTRPTPLYYLLGLLEDIPYSHTPPIKDAKSVIKPVEY